MAEGHVFSSEMQPVVNERADMALLSQTRLVTPIKNIRSSRNVESTV